MQLAISLAAALSAAGLGHAAFFLPSGTVPSSHALSSASPTPSATPINAPDKSVSLIQTEEGDCFIEFKNILGCTGRSEQPIGQYDAKTGCVYSGIADPIVNDLCGNYVTFYPVHEDSIYVESADRDMEVQSGDVFYGNGTDWIGHQLGLSPGCSFRIAGPDEKYQGIIGPQKWCLAENDSYSKASVTLSPTATPVMN